MDKGVWGGLRCQKRAYIPLITIAYSVGSRSCIIRAFLFSRTCYLRQLLQFSNFSSNQLIYLELLFSLLTIFYDLVSDDVVTVSIFRDGPHGYSALRGTCPRTWHTTCQRIKMFTNKGNCRLRTPALSLTMLFLDLFPLFLSNLSEIPPTNFVIPPSRLHILAFIITNIPHGMHIFRSRAEFFSNMRFISREAE